MLSSFNGQTNLFNPPIFLLEEKTLYAPMVTLGSHPKQYLELNSVEQSRTS